ncbi:MAG: ParB/RepB/Spo0J family partition protein [Gammaproteobacteria bacterium]|nr:MAG: ParB/RepB/Spo0J family partition protein [Gammaproteobacteria bacterium]
MAAAKKRGLGRGLDALLGDSRLDYSKSEQSQGNLLNLAVDLIQRGRYQPRMDMHTESLQDLADSIRVQGLVQPIVVRPIGENRYEIIAGERRWRAAQLAELHEIPVLVRDVSDQAAVAMALIENIQREDLNPLEEANALQRLIDEFEMTHQQAAEAVGRSRAAVSNLLRLRELNEDVKELLMTGALEMGHARALLALTSGSQSEAAHQVAKKALSVRETESLVRRLMEGAKQRPKSHQPDPDVRALQNNLAEKLGARVQIHSGARGKGKLVIHYNNLDELDGILQHIK